MCSPAMVASLNGLVVSVIRATQCAYQQWWPASIVLLSVASEQLNVLTSNGGQPQWSCCQWHQSNSMCSPAMVAGLNGLVVSGIRATQCAHQQWWPASMVLLSVASEQLNVLTSNGGRPQWSSCQWHLSNSMCSPAMVASLNDLVVSGIRATQCAHQQWWPASMV